MAPRRAVQHLYGQIELPAVNAQRVRRNPGVHETAADYALRHRRNHVLHCPLPLTVGQTGRVPIAGDLRLGETLKHFVRIHASKIQPPFWIATPERQIFTI